MSFYQVTVDGDVLADQSHPSFRMSAGKLKQQISNAGSLSITIPKKNTVQRKITKMESVIEVLHDEKPIWSGRCNAIEESSVGKMKIGAEGMLCALKDTILAPQTFSGFDYQLLDAIIAAHNSAARNVYQRFTSFAQHAPHFIHTLDLENYATAWAVLEAFLKECGGFFLPVCSGIDMKNGILWDCQFTDRCEQVIRDGVGLLSFKRTQKADGTYNAILPTGKLPKEQQTEGGDNNLYLTGYSYSNGLYVSEASSKLLELNISPRFRRVMYKHYNDIETQADLAAAAVNDLEAKSKESDIVEVKALDMSYYDPTVPPLEPGKLGRVCTTRFDYDDWLPVVEKELDLVKPWKSTVVLGGSRTAISSMTGGGSSSGGSVSSGRSSEESAQHAVLYVAQELTNNQKAVARQNIGAASASDIPSNVPDSLSDLTNDMALVLYDRAQSLNDAQKAQFRENIGAAMAVSEVHEIVIEPSGDSWVLSNLTGNTWQAVFNNCRNCVLITGDTTIGDRRIKPDYVCEGANSVEIGFSWQRYDSSTAEGVAFILTAPSNGSTGTIRRITGANIGSGGGTLTGAVRYDTQQSLQTTDKEQARSNIGAGKTTVSVSGNTMTIKDEESGASSTHSLVSGGALPAIAAGDAFKHLRVKYDESGVEWAAVDVYHKIFFYNEATGAVTKFEGGAATGAHISEALNTLYYSTYIIGFSRDSSTNDVTWNYYLPMDDFAPSRSGLETVRFYRQTTTGIEVLTIDTSTSTATKTVIPSGSSSGSGNFVKITYNSNTAAVTHNGEAITGAQIKALLDQEDAGAIMVDTNGSPNAVYRLKNIYANGDVEFEGELGDVVMNVVVPAASSTGSATITRKAQVFYYIDGTTVKSAVTNYAVTGQQIQNATIDNGLAPIVYKYDSARYVTDEFHFSSFHSGGMIFRTLDGKQQIFINWDSSTATITQAAGWAANILFYLDGTTVKYSGTNTAVTGGDVHAISLAVGIMPVIRQTSNNVDRFFHLDRAHSGGLEFRLLDGTKKLVLNFTSSTATITNL